MIDDEYTKIRYFEKALVDKGFDVKVLRDINEAWNYFTVKREEVCAIILDLLLPKPKILGPLSEGQPIGVILQKHLLEQLKVTGQIVPVAVLTQLSELDNQDIFEHLRRQQKKEYANWPLQAWMKVGLDPDDFALEFTTWLNLLKSLP